LTWAREKGYSKYRERIAWLEWEVREKDKRIKELESMIPLLEIKRYEKIGE
jgi:hypothetical protein